MLLWLLALACAPDPLDTSAVDAPPPPGDYRCDPTMALDPALEVLTSGPSASFHVESLEVEAMDRLSDDRLLAVGRGGLFVLDVADTTAEPLLLAQLEAFRGPIDDVAVVDETRAAIIQHEGGLGLVDLTSATSPQWLFLPDGTSAKSVAATPDLIAVVVGEQLQLLDADGELLSTLEGVPAVDLEFGDGVLYAVHPDAGMTVVDVSDPYAPIYLGQLDAPSAVHVTVDGDLAVVSRGAAGATVLDVSAPRTPAAGEVLEVLGSARAASITDGVIAVADREGLMVFEATAADDVALLGFARTPLYSMSVVTDATGAWVGDFWSVLRIDIHPERLVGMATLEDRGETGDADGAATFALENTGSEPLEVWVDAVAGVQVIAPSEITPGEVGLIDVTLNDGVEMGRACLGTSDPDHPRIEVTISPEDDALPPVGDLAADFTLPELETGTQHHLASQLGQPVVLGFFATWCPLCQTDIVDLDNVRPELEGAGVVVWSVFAEGDDRVAPFVDALGVTGTVLLDETGEVDEAYGAALSRVGAIYPRTWVIGPDGRVLLVDTTGDLAAVVDAALGAATR
jgi:peroxiredoxin